MNLTLPNGGIIINATTIIIDSKGVITCTAEVISKTENTTGEVRIPNGFCSEAERLLNRQSEKSYSGAVRNVRARQAAETVRMER